MRKLLVIALLAALLIPVFADDGTVLPAGVFRARVIPAFGWAPGGYDNNGKYTAFSNTGFPAGSITVPNLGFALEYGITDWVTLALQWAPGITFASNMPVPAGTSSTVNTNGLSNLFAGVLFQIVGPKAPVVSDTIRFDLAPGVSIPLGGANFSTQAQNAVSGSAVTYANPDKQTLGLGGRAYFDYVFSPRFFLDLYSQFIYYPGTVAFKDSSFSNYATYAYLLSTYGLNYNPNVGYGYDLRVELDPHYNFDIADGVNLAFNCAFRLDATPDLTYGGTSQSNTHTSLFTANPAVSVFLTKTFMPLEFVLDYGQPLAGVNAPSAYSLDLQIEAYFKL